MLPPRWALTAKRNDAGVAATHEATDASFGWR